MRRSTGVAVGLAALALVALVGCSNESTVKGGNASATTPVPSETPSPTLSATPQREVAPGIPEPSNAVTPRETPNILRAKQASAAAKFAQGMASALMYNEPVFAPRDGDLRAVDLQFVTGLSVFATDKYYSWILDDKTFRANRENIAGLLFIPPQDGEKRGYSIPAVQQQEYRELDVAEGPPSSVDGSPTVSVRFLLTGNLRWEDAQGRYWVAPVQRQISYVVAEQNANWSLDSWTPSRVIIGQAKEMSEADAMAYRFSLLDPKAYPSAPIDTPMPSLPPSEGE